MAVGHELSNIYTKQAAVPFQRNDRMGQLYWVRFSHTQAVVGDAGSDVILWKVESGCRIVPHLSTIRYTAFGSARVMQIGHAAYTDPDGTAVVADLDAFLSALDVSAAGTAFWSAGTLGSGLESDDTKLFRAQANLIATVTGGTWPANAIIRGVIAYMPVG